MIKKIFSSLFPKPSTLKQVKKIEELPDPKTELLYWVWVSIPDYFFGYVEILKSSLGEDVVRMPVVFDTENPSGTIIALFTDKPKFRFVKYISLSEIEKIMPEYRSIVYSTTEFSKKMDELGSLLKMQSDIYAEMIASIDKFLKS